MVAGKSCGAAITTVQSAACNSVVLAAASDRHKNYSALGAIPYGRRTADEAAENVGAFIQKSALYFFKISISKMMILLMNFRSKVS